jgi:hypothetical protein
METSTLVKTLVGVVNGVSALEEYATVITNAALEDVLLRVSKDYGLNYAKLLDDYKDDVLDKHVTTYVGGDTCKAKLGKSRKCRNRAVCRGYCRKHVVKNVSEKTKDVTAESYVDKQRKIKNVKVATVEDVFESMNVRIVPPSIYIISKPSNGEQVT